MANCILFPPQHLWAVGLRFHPTDEELLNHYLKNKMLGNESLVECIPQVDDICKFDPRELIHSPSNEQELFFFSASDFEHSIGTGYWESTGKDRKIIAQGTNNLIGTKKTLAFYSGQAPNGTRTNWVIHVYHLHSDTSSAHMDRLVICRLKRKKSDENDNVGGTVGEIQEIPGNGQSLFQPGLVDDENCLHEGTPNGSTNDHDSRSMSDECSRVQTPGTMTIQKARRNPLNPKIFKHRFEEYIFSSIPREDRLQMNYIPRPQVRTVGGHGSVESRVKFSSGILTAKCIHHKASPASAYVARASIGLILFFTVARQLLRYGHWS